MHLIIPALWKSLFTLKRGSLWPCLLAPFAVALVVLVALLWWGYLPCVDFAPQIPPLSWLVNQDKLGLAMLLSGFAIWALFSSAAYLVALLVTALFTRPRVTDDIARKDYPELIRMGRSGTKASVRNTLIVALGFTLGWGISLPLLMIPGVGFILPLLLLGWLNRYTFANDPLIAFATPEEWQNIQQRDAKPLFVMGLMLAMLAHIPFLGLFVPGVAALAYTHYHLAMLKQLRGESSKNGVP